jgi:hypothetical protein
MQLSGLERTFGYRDGQGVMELTAFQFHCLSEQIAGLACWLACCLCAVYVIPPYKNLVLILPSMDKLISRLFRTLVRSFVLLIISV